MCFEKKPNWATVDTDFVIQSPRWLVLKDRPEDGMKALRQLRDGKFTDQEIEEEFAVIVAGIRQEVEQGSFQDIFKRDQFRRTMVVLGCNFLLQATGQIFTQMYGALFVKSLGTINPFTVTIILAVVNTLTAILAMVLTDKLGRRFQLLVGASIQAAAMMTMGGLGTASNITGGMKIGIVSMMVVTSFGYSLGWAPTAHILSAEIPSTRCRDMTYRTASVLNVATQYVCWLPAFSQAGLTNACFYSGSPCPFPFRTCSTLPTPLSDPKSGSSLDPSLSCLSSSSMLLYLMCPAAPWRRLTGSSSHPSR